MTHTGKLLVTAFTAILALQPHGAHASDEVAFANLVADNELDVSRGTGTSDVFNLSNLTATLSNNSNIGGISGNNTIEPGALAGLTGVASLIQNSGNNVVIQNSTIVNVTFDNSAPVTIR